MPKLTTEKIAEIRNALHIINLTAELIKTGIPAGDKAGMITNEVKRIGKLLPVIKFEGGK